MSQVIERLRSLDRNERFSVLRETLVLEGLREGGHAVGLGRIFCRVSAPGDLAERLLSHAPCLIRGGASEICWEKWEVPNAG